MKRIAFILGSMGRGGAERVISILSRSYAERGYETDIIVLLSNTLGYDLHPTTRLIDFSGNTSSRIKRLPYWIKSLKKYVKENKPDVIVSFAARINVIVLNSVGKKARIVVSERNDPRYDGRGKLVDFLTKHQYGKADSVVFQTERAKEYFPNLKNGVIIPNPISVQCEAGEPKEGKIVTVGRLTPQKNQRLLIEAFSDIAAEFPSASLDIYGAGELEDNLRGLAEQLGLSGRVVLHGNSKNVHECIKDASVFCLSSDYEGLSNAFLEAMMMGIPCVCTKCAGADEYIKDGENGLLVDVGDRAGLANALRELLSDDGLRKKFGVEGKVTSIAFSEENVMKIWDKVILGEEK